MPPPLRGRKSALGRGLPPRHLSGRTGTLVPLDSYDLPQCRSNTAPGPDPRPKPFCGKRALSAPHGHKPRRHSATALEILGCLPEKLKVGGEVNCVSPDRSAQGKRPSRPGVRFASGVKSCPAVSPDAKAAGPKPFHAGSGSFVDQGFFDSLLGGGPLTKRCESKDDSDSDSDSDSDDGDTHAHVRFDFTADDKRMWPPTRGGPTQGGL